jgi:hypothetical protein
MSFDPSRVAPERTGFGFFLPAFANRRGSALVNEIEARACPHASMIQGHPYTWGRLAGPLVVWAALFVLMTVGGILSRPDPASSPVIVTQQQE